MQPSHSTFSTSATHPMAQRAPHSVNGTHYCVVGDVTIDASVAIAPGVVFQASRGSRIVVEKGACIAAGVCVQSRGGVLTIAAGVSLGANVLVVGHGTVGENACVSPGSTLINPTIDNDAILPPNALIGDKPTSPQANGFGSNGFGSNGLVSNGFVSNGFSSNGFEANTFVAPEPVRPKPPDIPDLTDQSNTFVSPPPLNQPLSQPFNQPDVAHTRPSAGNGSSNNGVQSNYSSGPSSNGAASGNTKGSAALTVRSTYDRVYGREQINDLISTLFPNRQPLNDHSPS